MFHEIEKNYRRNHKWKKFITFYWIISAIVVLQTIYIKDLFQSSRILLLYAFLEIFLCILLYFINDYDKTLKKFKKEKSFNNNLKNYIYQLREHQIDSLIDMLKQYNFKTKDDLKLAIDYYNNMQPMKIKSGLLSWVSTISITLFSIFETVYDKEKNIIDFSKLLVLLNTTISFILIITIFYLIIRYISNDIFANQKIISGLNEDLCYIYLNFDKYFKEN